MKRMWKQTLCAVCASTVLALGVAGVAWADENADVTADGSLGVAVLAEGEDADVDSDGAGDAGDAGTDPVDPGEGTEPEVPTTPTEPEKPVTPEKPD